MTERDRLIQAVKSFKLSVEPRRPVWRGWLVDIEGNGNARVSEEPGYVYVRLDRGDANSGDVIKARRNRLRDTPGWPVIVGIARQRVWEYTVLDIDFEALGGAIDGLPTGERHADTHLWNAPSGSDDTVYPRFLQLYDFGVWPGSGLSVNVQSGIFNPSGTKHSSTGINVSLTPYMPSADRRYVLLSLTPSGTIHVVAGDELPFLTVEDIPQAISTDHWELAAIKLRATDTTIVMTPAEENIVDLRFAALGWNNTRGITAHEIPYTPGESVGHIFDETLNSGLMHACILVDEGGLNISWPASEIWDATVDTEIDTDAGSGACTDNLTNYLVWLSGSTLTLRTTPPDQAANEIGIAHIVCMDGDIWAIHQNDRIHTREYELSGSIGEMFPSVVTNGLVVSEDADATNAFDLNVITGTYFVNGHLRKSVTGFNSRDTNLVRWYHNAGVWTSDTDAELDNTQWDNGTNRVAVSVSKYYAWLIFMVEETLHVVYPSVEYNTVAQAIEGGGTNKPPGFIDEPTLMCVVLRGNDAALPTAGGERWIDLRPLTTATINAGIVTDHGNLAGLADDDHTQYLLVDGSRSLSGVWTAGQAIILPNTGLRLWDTGGDHYLTIKPNEDLAANRILNLITGDAARTITLQGNPTLDDWFDQAVKVAASPTFANVYVPDGGFVGINGDAGWTFDSSNGDVSTVDSVGIGTLSPSTKTEVVYVSSYTGSDSYNNPEGLKITNTDTTVGNAVVINLRNAPTVANDGYTIKSILRANNDVDFQIARVLSLAGNDDVRLHIDNNGSVGIGTTSQFGNGAGVIGIANAGTNPSVNPTDGGVLYSDAGAGKWWGSGGTTTTFGPAEPHCSDCGRDFVVEFTNEKYGHLIVCMWCLTHSDNGNHKGVVKRDKVWKEPNAFGVVLDN